MVGAVAAVYMPTSQLHKIMIHGFNYKKFQRKIDERVGLNRDGKPILRLVHAPSVTTWALGEVIPRYWTKRRKESGEWKYEQPDRWVIEKRLEKESYWDAHQAARFQTIPATGEVIDIGPPPEDFYVFEYLIAEHDGFQIEGEPQCCKKAWEGGTVLKLNHRLELVEERVGGRRRCWGKYRDPNDSDLAKIEQAVKVMNESPYFNPYLPITQEQLIAIEAQANLDAERMADEANKRMKENSDDFIKLHGWRLTNTDAGKRSKYFLTSE